MLHRVPRIRHRFEWVSRFHGMFHGDVPRWMFLLFLGWLGGLVGFSSETAAQEAQWIWVDTQAQGGVPEGAGYFRKSFVLRSVDRAEITIVADDEYELFVNGRRVGAGDNLEKFLLYDVTRYLTRGRNVVAVKVKNTKGATAALAARVSVREEGEDWRNYSTDGSWRTSLNPLPFWNTTLYNDQRWSTAAELGELGRTAPWDLREELDDVAAPDEPLTQTERFKIDPAFVVTELLGHEKTGSLIAMTFNEFGHMLISREGGPLLVVFDSNQDGNMDKVREYCTKVQNCQGILALNGEVFVTGQGPDGVGLYRLADKDQDGKLEDITTLVKFDGPMGEHGPHGIVLGSDGMLYMTVGGDVRPTVPFTEASPYLNPYEGDLLPRYEDPSGHASEVKAPGAYVMRTDLRGKKVELVAGGFRNAYDLVFNREGELLVHDSDMESDIGTTWYRPTRLYHVTPGGEYGWRTGWSKWPADFVDNLPGILDTGRGAPTGAVLYDHYAFPTQYRGAVFLADWSQGRILAVQTQRQGASYVAASEVFLQGQPLNVTDLEVGPDGSLYFVTGGRGTNGGIYRIHWKGEIPAAESELGEGVAAAVKHPQLHAAWARQNIAQARQNVLGTWNENITAIARGRSNPWQQRVRALELMQWFGPVPDSELLIEVSKSQNELVRAKAAEMMGLHPDASTRDRLRELLRDTDRLVRRRACEGLIRANQTVPFSTLTPLLTSDDRFESWAARRLLERMPVELWRKQILTADHHRLFINGSLALLIAHPSQDNGLAVLQRFSQIMNGFISDRDFIDMLRVAQVAFERGEIKPDDYPDLGKQLSAEFPAGDDQMNRELVRLLAFYAIDEPLERYLEYIRSSADQVLRLHVAMHMRFLKEGWPQGKKLLLLDFYREAREWGGGGNYVAYIDNIERDFAKNLSVTEAITVLAKGEQWPHAALGALYALPSTVDEKQVTTLTQLDTRLAANADPATSLLRTGIMAILAASESDAARDHLRTVWDDEPERRPVAAMALAQHPDTNWEYLVRSLPVVDGEPAREVLRKLTEVDAAPGEAEHYRQAILVGLRLEENGGLLASNVLQHWTGLELTGDTNAAEPTPVGEGRWQAALETWQAWYADQYPDHPRAELPLPPDNSKWQYDELLAHLLSEQAMAASAEKGALVFEKAQCVKCHRFGSRGESLGPDLTGISKRFMKKEVLTSILFPSHVVSDQYQAKTVITTQGRSYTGIVAAGGQGETVVLTSDGAKVTLEDAQIDQIVPNPNSAMPAGLLDSLTLEEISDLFAYLGLLPQSPVAGRAAETRR
jgi:putative heme-binding domain-containing protein